MSKIVATAKFAVRNTLAVIVAAGNLLISANLWFLVFYFGGVACIVIGVRQLAGDSYAFMATGGLAIFTAAMIRKELSRG